jgi:hypothetical protein
VRSCFPGGVVAEIRENIIPPSWGKPSANKVIDDIIVAGGCFDLSEHSGGFIILSGNTLDQGWLTPMTENDWDLTRITRRSISGVIGIDNSGKDIQ